LGRGTHRIKIGEWRIANYLHVAVPHFDGFLRLSCDSFASIPPEIVVRTEPGGKFLLRNR
jgi:hypothetical protein